MLLYRRAMMRVAERVRAEVKGLATVLGDSVGQVASQTLPNLAAVYEGAVAPVLAPLIGLDKHATVRIAKRIGTFEVSIRPAEDCCGLMVAKHPQTAASAEALLECERDYDLAALAADALERREVHRLPDVD
jgi:thiamine biosynthesis protein ThiI